MTGAKRGVEPAARSNINNIKVISIHMFSHSQTYKTMLTYEDGDLYTFNSNETDCSSNIADKVNNPSTLCA